MKALSGAFRGSEHLVSHPRGEGLSGAVGCGLAEGLLVVGEADVVAVAAGVVDGWPSSTRRHDPTIAETETLDTPDFRGDNKSMGTAKPETGSIRKIATCNHCWEMIEFTPGTGWWHSSTGEAAC